MSSTNGLDPSTFVGASPAPPAGGPSLDPSTFVGVDSAAPAAAPTPPPAKPAPNLLQRVTSAIEGPQDQGGPMAPWEVPRGMAAGAIKHVAAMAGNILDMITKPRMSPAWETLYKYDHPNASTEEARQAFADQDAKTSTGRATAHVLDAANWLRSGGQPQGFNEQLGSIGMQTLELLGADGIMRLAGPVTETGAVMSTADELKNAQQAAGFLRDHPKIAGLVAVGLRAAKDAVTMGGQSYAATEDPEEAKRAAKVGAVFGPLAEALGPVANYLRKIAPKEVEIAGEKVPAMYTQVNEAGMPVPTGQAGVPARMAAAQQQGAGVTGIQSVAQRAARSILDRINATRAAFGGSLAGEPSRLLAAPEEAQPVAFTFGTAPTTEEATGKMVQSAQKVAGRPAAFEPQYTTSSTATGEPIRPGGPTAEEGQMGADVRTATTPEPRGETVTGPAARSTTNANEAHSWLREAEDFQSSPAYDAMTDAQKSFHDQQTDALRQQLDLYDQSPYARRFDPVDPNAAQFVRSFGDAADLGYKSVQPVYDVMDEASRNQFSGWREQAKTALKVMRKPSSMEAYDAAAERYRQANDAIDDLITRNGHKVTNEDYRAAREGYKYASRLDELHTLFEGMTNGITLNQSDQGFTRVMTGSTKRLRSYLGKAQNESMVRDLIGDEGITNLTKITELLGKAGSGRSVQDVLRNVVNNMGTRARVHGLSGTGMIGGYLAGSTILPHVTGLSPHEAGMAGAVMGESARAVLRYAATRPHILNMIAYAAEHGLTPQHYAPLISRAIIDSTQPQSAGPEEKKSEALPSVEDIVQGRTR